MEFSQGQEKKLTQELFENPGKDYRSAPFWGWNGDLQTEELLKQIDAFKEMGFGGFHMHARAGLVTPYLTDEFMDRVRDCCKKAEESGMYAWLYDEDKYPSGPAGGIVTANPAYTRRYLRMTPVPNGDPREKEAERGYPRAKDSTLLAVYDVTLDGEGYLVSAARIADASQAKNPWYAYFECCPASEGVSQSYVDTLNPKAIEAFARSTYDRYRDTVGEYFGNVSPAIFTDEPQYPAHTRLAFALDQTDVILPWTDDLCTTYQQTYQEDLLDVLPEMIWNLPDGQLSRARWRFHDHLAERFTAAFCDTLGNWCDKNGILFNGHVMGEGSLETQTRSVGEAMRCYRGFQLPGIDVLGHHKLEYTTAKQAQSAVHQQGSAAMMSELYGVSGWDFDFRGYKLQGDWQAAMGVTLRVPHHCWYTMHGDSKRDYPGSISYQSPWWKQYHLIEDHFARVNTAMTRGQADVHVAVVHPIESEWIQFGPGDQSGAAMQELDGDFHNIITLLVSNLIDFDFISESRLPALCDKGGNPLKVGKMAYDAVIVPALYTLRESTVARLEAFEREGGQLIFLGACPKYVDGTASDRVQALYDRAQHCSGIGAPLVDALRGQREVDARLTSGNRANHLIYQMRKDGDQKWLFVATTRSLPSPDLDYPAQIGLKYNVGRRFDPDIVRFELNGTYALTEYDTLTGEIRRLPAQYRGGKTIFSRRWYMHDSLLLNLTPGKYEGESFIAPVAENSWRCFDDVAVSLDEPNVMLLDMAEFSLDGGAFEPQEEILRLENICRKRIGVMPRKFGMPQPYKLPDVPATHKVTLRFVIESEIPVAAPKLALENEFETEIALNGEAVDNKAVGWYTDRSIHVVDLPALRAGKNELLITRPLGLRTLMEACYLLGDFGVRVRGVKKVITEPVRRLAFGSWTDQGLPFYGGNVTYHLNVQVDGGVLLRCPYYRGALIQVRVDGVERGPIIYSPYAMDLSDLTPGTHQIDLTVYGSRQNCFAPVHHLASFQYSQGPDAFRSTGDLWNYEYHFEDKGLMASPRIYKA